MPPTRRFLIRPAIRDDVPAMARLAEAFADYMRQLGDPTGLRLDAEALARDGFGPNPAFRGLVAVSGHEVLGFLLHHDGYDTDAACRLLFVVDLFVAQDARGQGIGSALMDEARQVAAWREARQLVWTVDRRNAPARRFYERIGAQPVRGLDLMVLDVDEP